MMPPGRVVPAGAAPAGAAALGAAVGNAGLALPGGHVLDIEIAMTERYWADERPGDFLSPATAGAT